MLYAYVDPLRQMDKISTFASWILWSFPIKKQYIYLTIRLTYKKTILNYDSQ